jgi:hypothetical protein
MTVMHVVENRFTTVYTPYFGLRGKLQRTILYSYDQLVIRFESLVKIRVIFYRSSFLGLFITLKVTERAIRDVCKFHRPFGLALR